MPEGAGLRLTTAKYYTPSGDSIQAKGIKPDIVVPFIPSNGEEKVKSNNHFLIREKDLPNHLENDNDDEKDSEKDDETTEIETRLKKDNQLRTALYILKGLNIASQK